MPYIIDSLGWALFKLKDIKMSKEYLQVALKLMPADPIETSFWRCSLEKWK